MSQNVVHTVDARLEQSLNEICPSPVTMRKALAQNPNLVRTLVGLSLTLIIVLSYAVYSASLTNDYYVYTSDPQERSGNISLITEQHYPVGEQDWTMWTWGFNTEPGNLSWINATISGGVIGGEVSLTNAAEGFWSHPDLGDPEAEKFSCAVSCVKLGTHETTFDDAGNASITGLTHWDPARRDSGTVWAKSLSRAEKSARENIAYEHADNVWQIAVRLPGNHSDMPMIDITMVNEEFSGVKRFTIDPATELVWATFSVIGCFAVLLVPSFGIYFAAQAKERRAEKVGIGTTEDE